MPWRLYNISNANLVMPWRLYNISNANLVMPWRLYNISNAIPAMAWYAGSYTAKTNCLKRIPAIR
jgi:hypothetical protein